VTSPEPATREELDVMEQACRYRTISTTFFPRTVTSPCTSHALSDERPRLYPEVSPPSSDYDMALFGSKRKLAGSMASSLQIQALDPSAALFLHFVCSFDVAIAQVPMIEMRKAPASHLFPPDLCLVVRVYLAVAVGACDQHIVLDLQQPQLGDIVEELVGGAWYLVRRREVDVAVVAVELGQGKARGERGWRRGRQDFVEMVRER
jgi:hypothetical protein